MNFFLKALPKSRLTVVNVLIKTNQIERQWGLKTVARCRSIILSPPIWMLFVAVVGPLLILSVWGMRRSAGAE